MNEFTWASRIARHLVSRISRLHFCISSSCSIRMLCARSRTCIVRLLASSSTSLVLRSFSRLFFISILRIISLRSMLFFVNFSFSFSAASAIANLSSFVIMRLRSFRSSYSFFVMIFGQTVGTFKGIRYFLVPLLSLIFLTCQIQSNCLVAHIAIINKDVKNIKCQFS